LVSAWRSKEKESEKRAGKRLTKMDPGRESRVPLVKWWGEKTRGKGKL